MQVIAYPWGMAQHGRICGCGSCDTNGESFGVAVLPIEDRDPRLFANPEDVERFCKHKSPLLVIFDKTEDLARHKVQRHLSAKGWEDVVFSCAVYTRTQSAEPWFFVELVPYPETAQARAKQIREFRRHDGEVNAETAVRIGYGMFPAVLDARSGLVEETGRIPKCPACYLDLVAYYADRIDPAYDRSTSSLRNSDSALRMEATPRSADRAIRYCCQQCHYELPIEIAITLQPIRATLRPTDVGPR